MENRPAPLRSRRVCRFCLTENEPLSFIYDRELSKPFQVPLALQIMACVGIEVYSADGMPQMICNMCRWNLDRCYKFKNQCKKADEALRAYPMSGTLPRPFPPITSDPPDAGTKRQLDSRQVNDQPKKPRLDNGDRERRENAHPTQRQEEIRAEKQQREKEEQQQRRELYEEEDTQDVGSDAEHDANDIKNSDTKLEPGEIRVHACKQCDRTFPLLQALQLHVERAHNREREYKCTECDRSFFSKYDLTKHMSTHSEEKPFTCQICQRSFSRLNLLQRHEKIHRDQLKYGCAHCDREFFSTEDLEKHEESVHKAVKPYQCNICNKRFTYKQGLERHEMLHSEDKSFVCEYCKEAFRTSTKLARHLTTHAGHRPYLCKLCPRSFLLSHHLTRHMRSHSVEKRHQCEDCGKAFKRKESLDVHQLTHVKRTGMGLVCDVCSESCRNRADYVTHIKQHIEAGEKRGPDGLPPDDKDKQIVDTEEEEEEEEEEQYSDDDDDDYEPPSSYVYATKKQQQQQRTSKIKTESEDEQQLDKEESKKEQVVYVRGKDGNVVKKMIKTLMPIQRRSESGQEVVKTKQVTSPQMVNVKQMKEEIQEQTSQRQQKVRVDETEAQVQKIVASVFKEHKIPLKNQGAEQGKETLQSSKQVVQSVSTPTIIKEERIEQQPGSSSQKNTVRVIKRVVVRRPVGSSTDLTQGAITGPIRDLIIDPPATSSSPQQPATPSTSGAKPTKRYILRRIIRQGDTMREVIMHPDGTPVDPAELAKLPTANVVKRVVMKKPLNKNQNIDEMLHSPEDAKNLLKFMESGESTSKSNYVVLSNVSTPVKADQQSQSQQPVQQQAQQQSQQQKTISNDESEITKEKYEQLQKRVEQQRLKIEELEARKRQQQPLDYDADEMLPERHDESEDEQQLPLKRVFVKRKQSIYDEVREYNDDPTTTVKEADDEADVAPVEEEEAAVDTSCNAETAEAGTTEEITQDVASSETKVEQSEIDHAQSIEDAKIIIIKSEENQPDVDEMSRELCNILDSTDTVVKMQENVLNNLSTITSINEASSHKTYEEVAQEATLPEDQKPEAPSSTIEEEPMEQVVIAEDVEQAQEQVVEESAEQQDPALKIVITHSEEDGVKLEFDNSAEEANQLEAAESSNIERTETGLSNLSTQVLSETNDIFETSETAMEVDKSQEQANISESVIELSTERLNETINLNETADSRDSLEDKLSQMEG